MTPPQFGIERDLADRRADALAPVIFVGEAAARPADVRHLDRLQRGDDVVADAARIGDRRIGADPYAFVNAVAEMLGELAEDVAVDLRAGLRRVDRHGNLVRSPCRRDHHHAQQHARRNESSHGTLSDSLLQKAYVRAELQCGQRDCGGQYRSTRNPGNSLEVFRVSRHELRVVENGGRRDQQIHRRDPISSAFDRGQELPVRRAKRASG